MSGGEDKVLRVWDYDEGISYFKGVGHPGAITKVSEGVMLSLGENFAELEVHSVCRVGRSHYDLAHA